MVQRFSLTSSCGDQVCLLTASGELDLGSAPSLVVRGREAIRGGCARVVVNLTEVSFMDSAGLAALINLQRSADRAGGSLTVVCPDGPVRRLFAVSGTEDLLGVQRTAAA